MSIELWELSDGQIIRVQAVGSKKVTADAIDSASGKPLHIGVFSNEATLKQFLFDTLRLSVTHQGVVGSF